MTALHLTLCVVPLLFVGLYGLGVGVCPFLPRVLAETRLLQALSNRTICHVESPVVHKMIVHSMPKSGTSTYGQAFRELGFKDCEWMPWVMKRSKEAVDKANRVVQDCSYPYDGIPRSAAQLKAHHQILETLANFKHDLDSCDSAGDFPMGHYQVDIRIKQILWPGAKFVYVNRSMEEWLESHWRWDHRNDKFPPNESDPVVLRQKRQHFQHNRDVRSSVEVAILALQAASPELVLITNPGAGWETLLDFVFGKSRACQAPAAPWPHDIPKR